MYNCLEKQTNKKTKQQQQKKHTEYRTLVENGFKNTRPTREHYWVMLEEGPSSAGENLFLISASLIMLKLM